MLPKLLDDRDKNVREETKLLIIEIHRWIGPALKPMMTNFKPLQVLAVDVVFENYETFYDCQPSSIKCVATSHNVFTLYILSIYTGL